MAEPLQSRLDGKDVNLYCSFCNIVHSRCTLPGLKRATRPDQVAPGRLCFVRTRATVSLQTMAANDAHQYYSIRIICPQHDNHGPYNFSGQDDLITSNSKKIGDQFKDGEHHIEWHYSEREYDCTTLRSIIQAWKNQEYDPLPQGDSFAALSQLSKALWDYQCCPKWFGPFANDVREQHWIAHFRDGSHSPTWAFIALVFGWEDVFGLASMDIPSLGRRPYWNPENREYNQIAKIVGEEDYSKELSSTYNFVRNRCGKLEGTNRQVFDRVVKCFKARGIAILTDQEGNNDIISQLGVVGLLRLFESFLEANAGTPTHRSIPRGHRYPQRPFIWRMASNIVRHRHKNQAAESASTIQDNLDDFTERGLLSRIEEYCESSLSRFLVRNPAAGRRFRQLREDRLVLHENANPNTIWPGNTSPHGTDPIQSPAQELP